MGLCGRSRRLLAEWEKLEGMSRGRDDISVSPARLNPDGMPTAYLVEYRIRSICGVSDGADGKNPPVFAEKFLMRIELPEGYPGIDAQPVMRFLTRDEDGNEIPHPWHPNIRYSGGFAGRVCLNMVDSYTDLAWAVLRVASYLRYEVYHALNEPPYPEDQNVAAWVIRQGEENDWTVF